MDQYTALMKADEVKTFPTLNMPAPKKAQSQKNKNFKTVSTVIVICLISITLSESDNGRTSFISWVIEDAKAKNIKD